MRPVGVRLWCTPPEFAPPDRGAADILFRSSLMVIPPMEKLNSLLSWTESGGLFFRSVVGTDSRGRMIGLLRGRFLSARSA